MLLMLFHLLVMDKVLVATDLRVLDRWVEWRLY